MKGRKMLQVVLLLVLTLALTVSISYADAPQVSIAAVQVDGEKVAFNPGEEPVFINERIYVTLRTVGDALGAECSWDGENRVVTLVRNDKAIMLPVDAGMYYVDGAGYAYDQDMAPLMMNGRTWVPLRMVSESFGVTITWDGNKNTVKIDSTQGTKQVVASVNTPVLAAVSTQEGICDEFSQIRKSLMMNTKLSADNKILCYYNNQERHLLGSENFYLRKESDRIFALIVNDLYQDTLDALRIASKPFLPSSSGQLIKEITSLPFMGKKKLVLDGKTINITGTPGYIVVHIEN